MSADREATDQRCQKHCIERRDSGLPDEATSSDLLQVSEIEYEHLRCVLLFEGCYINTQSDLGSYSTYSLCLQVTSAHR